MTDTFRLLGPEVFSGIAEVELRLAKASARLDSLIESIATDTEVTRQVQLRLQRVNKSVVRLARLRWPRAPPAQQSGLTKTRVNSLGGSGEPLHCCGVPKNPH